MRVRLLTVSTLVVVSACSGSPTGPSGPGVMRIAGPSTIAPSSTTKFSAIYFKNGGESDVTASTTWSVSNSDAVRINSDGVATGLSAGEATITAKFQGLTDVRPVLILEANTFRFLGRITDAGAGIGGATIEVVRGRGTGLRTVSKGFAGDFVLYGVAGSIQLQVTADGYAPRLVDFEVNSHLTVAASIELTPVPGPPGIFNGRWTFWLWAPPCGFLPPPATQRSYVADISHTGVRLVVKLSGDGVQAEAAIGQAGPGGIWFRFPFWPLGIDGNTPIYGLVDTFRPPAFLGINADVSLNDLDATLPGTYEGFFDGSFDYYPTGQFNVVNQCVGRGRAGLLR